MANNRILLNSIWPNSEGPLGKNKAQIPDGVTVKWPEGDALVGNFVYKDGLISGFVDTNALIVNESKTSTVPYDYVNIHLDSIKEGDMNVLQGDRCKYFYVTFGSGNSGETIVLGTTLANCTTIDDVFAVGGNYKTNYIIEGVWNESLESLVEGYDGPPEYPFGMFQSCSNLITFNSDLRSLTNGGAMFSICDNLETFNADVSSLTEAYQMFYKTYSLSSFTNDLPSLKNGEYMFQNSGIRTFVSDLSSLTNGHSMFYYSERLTSFTSNLSSLTNGDWMFTRCKLNSNSVKNIIDTINTVSSGDLRLDVGCNDTAEDADIFAQEIGYADMTSLLSALEAKGWTVISCYTGRPSVTYSMRSLRADSLPIFVKPIETENDFEYTSQDGSKKYILDIFHRSTGSIDGYTQFNSLEEAISDLHLIKI